MIRKKVMLSKFRILQNTHFRQLRQVSAGCRVVHVQLGGKFGGRDNRVGENGFDQIESINLFVP